MAATTTSSTPDAMPMARWCRVRVPVNRRWIGAASRGSRTNGHPKPSEKNTKYSNDSPSAPAPATPPTTTAEMINGPVHGRVIGASRKP